MTCPVCTKEVPYLKTVYPIYGDKFEKMESCGSCNFDKFDDPTRRRKKEMICAGGGTINQSPGYFHEVSKRRHVDSQA